MSGKLRAHRPMLQLNREKDPKSYSGKVKTVDDEVKRKSISHDGKGSNTKIAAKKEEVEKSANINKEVQKMTKQQASVVSKVYNSGNKNGKSSKEETVTSYITSYGKDIEDDMTKFMNEYKMKKVATEEVIDDASDGKKSKEDTGSSCTVTRYTKEVEDDKKDAHSVNRENKPTATASMNKYKIPKRNSSVISHQNSILSDSHQPIPKKSYSEHNRHDYTGSIQTSKKIQKIMSNTAKLGRENKKRLLTVLKRDPRIASSHIDMRPKMATIRTVSVKSDKCRPIKSFKLESVRRRCTVKSRCSNRVEVIPPPEVQVSVTIYVPMQENLKNYNSTIEPTDNQTRDSMVIKTEYVEADSSGREELACVEDSPAPRIVQNGLMESDVVEEKSHVLNALVDLTKDDREEVIAERNKTTQIKTDVTKVREIDLTTDSETDCNKYTNKTPKITETSRQMTELNTQYTSDLNCLKENETTRFPSSTDVTTPWERLMIINGRKELIHLLSFLLKYLLRMVYYFELEMCAVDKMMMLSDPSSKFVVNEKIYLGRYISVRRLDIQKEFRLEAESINLTMDVDYDTVENILNDLETGTGKANISRCSICHFLNCLMFDSHYFAKHAVFGKLLTYVTRATDRMSAKVLKNVGSIPSQQDQLIEQVQEHSNIVMDNSNAQDQPNREQNASQDQFTHRMPTHTPSQLLSHHTASSPLTTTMSSDLLFMDSSDTITKSARITDKMYKNVGDCANAEKSTTEELVSGRVDVSHERYTKSKIIEQHLKPTHLKTVTRLDDASQTNVVAPNLNERFSALKRDAESEEIIDLTWIDEVEDRQIAREMAFINNKVNYSKLTNTFFQSR